MMLIAIIAVWRRIHSYNRELAGLTNQIFVPPLITVDAEYVGHVVGLVHAGIQKERAECIQRPFTARPASIESTLSRRIRIRQVAVVALAGTREPA